MLTANWTSHVFLVRERVSVIQCLKAFNSILMSLPFSSDGLVIQCLLESRWIHTSTPRLDTSLTPPWHLPNIYNAYIHLIQLQLGAGLTPWHLKHDFLLGGNCLSSSLHPPFSWRILPCGSQGKRPWERLRDGTSHGLYHNRSDCLPTLFPPKATCGIAQCG